VLNGTSMSNKVAAGALVACGDLVLFDRNNEAYLLHASTSPFYPLFASLDVGAQMMKGRNGFRLWNDATRLAIGTPQGHPQDAAPVRGTGR